MASQKTRALIIRTTDYSETSQVLSVYTRDFGRISLLAKGSKRKRAGSEGPLDVFQVMDIVFLEKSGTHGSSPLHLLTDRKLVEDYHGLRRNLERGYAAFFIAELLQNLTEQHDPGPEVYDLANIALSMLCQTSRPNVVVHSFEVHFLNQLGLLPRIDACVLCGGRLDASGDVIFVASSGGVVCENCADSVPERLYVSRGAVAVLNKLGLTPLIKVERLRISGKIGSDVRKMLSRIWMHIMGREPRMLKYLH